jgi:hypothetical protein
LMVMMPMFSLFSYRITSDMVDTPLKDDGTDDRKIVNKTDSPLYNGV